MLKYKLRVISSRLSGERKSSKQGTINTDYTITGQRNTDIAINTEMEGQKLILLLALILGFILGSLVSAAPAGYYQSDNPQSEMAFYSPRDPFGDMRADQYPQYTSATEPYTIPQSYGDSSNSIFKSTSQEIDDIFSGRQYDNN